MTSRTANLYRQLGVKRVINARGSTTIVGGSMLSEEVLAAIDEANRQYVEMEELLEKSGQATAELLETDAAMITSGCFAALVLGAASIMTGKDPDKISRLPDTTNMRNEFLVQKKTRLRYDRCISVAGGKLIDVGDEDGTTAEDLESAMGPDTAGILYFAQEEDAEGVLTIPEVVDIAKKNDLPVLIDAAAEVYPLERITGVAKSGADLVCFSGKYLGSAQSSGILCGRKDLVEAASLNNFISFEVEGSESFGNAIGRGYKIDRQEIVATVVALREWLTMNHEERFAIQERRIQTIESALKGLAVCDNRARLGKAGALYAPPNHRGRGGAGQEARVHTRGAQTRRALHIDRHAARVAKGQGTQPDGGRGPGGGRTPAATPLRLGTSVANRPLTVGAGRGSAVGCNPVIYLGGGDVKWM